MMNLGFTEHINQKPNYFTKKIWAGIIQNELIPWEAEIKKFGFSQNCVEYRPKVHTIRSDKSNRWKEGNKIHFVTGNRTKDRKQFAPVLTVQSTQEIIIHFADNYGIVIIDGRLFYERTIDSVYGESSMHNLAVNDGFESIEMFFNYFNTDFKGKLIHWTNSRY